mmetsp:Transcript_27686/g.33681  ORF Transcript_27686/g.33681 Transcript_27686/m.33681 type:complete len:512 (-) Transcript_27686:25-1560(-)|eukprot:CAMPEP_0172499336 /NCGR_PEP_ID=MMETSP1066-20121228/125725_1 /TAXON_ID=671091 /ORGANISM="Coscinodiscus wailesii, Strain CCMP2513" /LENGTH=511 /DNA_ID=CAMNT_0013273027 /DNA_START=87 /DNA_END=1622 /DNA_ORIENTATION=+
MTIELISLPAEIHHKISLFLPPMSIISVSTTNTSLHQTLLQNPIFYKLLLSQNDPQRLHGHLHRQQQSPTDNDGQNDTLSNLRRSYTRSTLTSTLPAVKWRSVALNRSTPDDREGHLLCQFSNERLVLTGGFCSDDRIHVLDIDNGDANWTALAPAGDDAPFVYGASLTALPRGFGDDINFAIRFGGFKSGGYRGETNEMYSLTIANDRRDKDQLTATWKKVETTGRPPRARSYHSATLINNDRYLLILGGMTPLGSIVSEALLDLQTWHWVDLKSNRSSQCSLEVPSGRHGHSAVWDERRNRVVVFGGGSGSDLLRSGRDNGQVWEAMVTFDTDTDVSLSWRLIKVDDDTVLNLDEKLCLGRCHVGVKTSPDTVLLFSGGGHPSTNGVLGYELATDTWIRPRVVNDGEAQRVPLPRFTAAGVVMDDWLVIHGGYAAGMGALGDVWVLDLCPFLQRDLPVCFDEGGAEEENMEQWDVGTTDWRVLNYLTQLLPMRSLVMREDIVEDMDDEY